KTMCGTVEYRDASLPGLEQTKVIHNLLKSTIMSATKILNKPWCVSVFKDNAGIVKFDHNHNICFKVETHNHPSALEPYGGAGTGIGGVIRDILGVGLGAKPIMNNDVFCFGPPELAVQDVPDGALHPLRVMKGVVAGVKDYGNKMGIPTVNGAVIFDPRYTANPLVYCGTVGIMPKEYSFGSASSGEYVVVVGGRTGRDGIHGATFSSGSLTNASEMSSSGAVQIGNPITEKKVLDTLLNARDKKLYTAITDCGAGGLSSAVGEMGEEIGVRIELEKVPLKYAGLNYTEIWISEAQERMVLSVPEENLKSLLELFTQEDVEAVVIGCFTNTKQLELFYQDVCVCSLSMEFLHNGLPLLTRKALWKKPLIKETKYEPARNLTGELLKILSDLNVCSKEWIIRQYDHEVQGMSVLKPLSGICNDGPQDAAVVKPFADSKKGITISCGINPRYSDIDPYYMAVSCIDEALRQIVAVGGSLEHSCILDNFSWGNTDKPEILGGLVRACLGCRDASLAYKVPFISGKDSLHNEYIVGNQTISIPQTLLISAMAVILDVEKVISADAKTEGNLIYCIGTTFAEMGGSCYYAVNNWQSGSVPKVDFQQNKAVFEKLSYCIDKGMLEACHDCSEGGMAVALAEMAFGGGLGMEIFLDKVKHHIPKDKPRDDILLFSESNGRFVVEVEEEKKENFEKILQGIPFSMIGKLTDKQKFLVYGIDNRLVVDCAVGVLKDAWQKPLRDFG
ncbi:MAG: phosphoribosylformylglycinamidine synthase subunit PurL, partial [Candidatus Omnitrophota bacterium]